MQLWETVVLEDLLLAFWIPWLQRTYLLGAMESGINTVCSGKA